MPLSIRQQQGNTLIEVLMAMFVLAFGILALMVAQLRGISNVQEAGNQTVAAQAAQTLMEGMLSNSDKEIRDGVVYTSYKHYTQSRGESLISCQSELEAQTSESYAKNTALSASELAGVQLANFRRNLCSNMLNATSIRAQVCAGDADSGLCKPGSKSYIINIEWGMQVADEDASRGENPLNIDRDGNIAYRYILPVHD